MKLGLDELIIATDASLVGRGCICLMVSLIYKKRALPLAFTVFTGKKGHLPEQAHMELVKKLHQILPYQPKRVVFLGDGEFDGIELQQTLSGFGWKYVCRTSHNVCDYYQKRFIIETFFSDQKSRGFNIDKSHLSSPQRLTRLLFAACLAYLYVFFFGDVGNDTSLCENDTPQRPL